MSVLVLTPHDLQGLVGMKEAIDIVEQGFREAAAYPIISAPRRRVHSPDGVRISNFPGGVHGLGVIGSLTISQLVTQAERNQLTLIESIRCTCCSIPKPVGCLRS